MRFMSGILLAILLVLCHTMALADSPVAGLFLATVGQVQIQREQQQLPAARKTALYAKDKILTGENARAQLRLIDGTIITLGANTGFRIADFDWDAKRSTESSVKLELISGAFRTVTGKALDVAGSDFSVQTPTGVIGVRGTDFWGGHLDANAVDVLLISGDHAVRVSNNNSRVTLEKPGQGTTLKADQS